MKISSFLGDMREKSLICILCLPVINRQYYLVNWNANKDSQRKIVKYSSDEEFSMILVPCLQVCGSVVLCGQSYCALHFTIKEQVATEQYLRLITTAPVTINTDYSTSLPCKVKMEHPGL